MIIREELWDKRNSANLCAILSVVSDNLNNLNNMIYDSFNDMCIVKFYWRYVGRFDQFWKIFIKKEIDAARRQFSQEYWAWTY